uniref:fibrobacter succinogenes major paralogous domain-containing protein n=1 Tax=Fibrobacter sp. TaxID=35828 RepID=UPI00388ED5DD
GTEYSEIWMAENLNYETSNSYCYDDDPDKCTQYGRLYTWAAAVGRSENECGYGRECGLPSDDVRGICPKGWHLPSQTEWNALFTAVGGSSIAGAKLKSQTGWTAYSGITNEDVFGFSALPAGYRYYDGYFYDGGDNAYFWSSTEYYSDNAYGMNLYYYNGGGALYSNDFKGYGFSVRCLRD